MENQRLVILQNPGVVSRFYLEGLIAGAGQLGIECDVLDMKPFWALSESQMLAELPKLADRFRESNVGAVLGYAWNGVMGFPTITDHDGGVISFIEALGIPNLLLWTDHPQFFNGRAALAKDVQPVLRAGNNMHFLKSRPAADELKTMLGWRNCHAINMAEDPLRWQPARNIKPECDLIVIGESWGLDERLAKYINDGDPQLVELQMVIAPSVINGLNQVWSTVADEGIRTKLKNLGKEWVDRRVQNEMDDTFRYFQSMEKDHADAVQWLRRTPDVYFQAVRQLWAFGNWQRPFYIEYLSRRFDVRRLGDSPEHWVAYRDQSAAYAIGRVAVNIPQAHDCEGLSHKPFQIAASRVAMLHMDRRGLSDCFRPGEEVETFLTPAEACDAAARLLMDEGRREGMAAAARRRLEEEHTWAHRLKEIFEIAGLDLNVFHTQASLR